MRNLLIAQALAGNPVMPTRQDLAELKDALRAFHENERGDNENLGRLLILGLILIPIVVLLALYGQEIVGVVKTEWGNVIGQKSKIKK